MAQSRQLLSFRGDPEETRRSALEACASLEHSEVLWVGVDAPETMVAATGGKRVRRLLGRSFDAVVLSFHEGVDADLLGQCHGFVRGGGALVLRLPDDLVAGQEKLAAYPYSAEDVGERFFEHLLTYVRTTGTALAPQREVSGTAEQAEIVACLLARFAAKAPTLTTLIADRGRGKSATLGLALAQLGGESLVVAASEESVAEVMRFAGDVAFARPLAAIRQKPRSGVIAVDEAARIPVPVLQALVRRHPDAHVVFATTTHGYEGTGRGFGLRFVEWLKSDPRELLQLTLDEPIRWQAGDPLERIVFDALLLDAEPSDVSDLDDEALATVRAVALDRDALVEHGAMLRGFFGLLVHAHYRTTPGDLHRMLDAPNLDLHALLVGDRVVGATWVAREGGLDLETIDAVYHGKTRLRGHALAESVVTHLACPEYGGLTMMRSVRIAVHPDLRRRGLGTTLIAHVHASYAPDLFGTVFGATPELVAFRRKAGYEIARVGASRGARTGEPSVLMLRPVSTRGKALMDRVRAEYARDLESQIGFLHEDDVLLDEVLLEALRANLPEPASLPASEVERLVCNYVYGPRTFESSANALSVFVAAHRAVLEELPEIEAALIGGRVLDRRPWQELCTVLGYPSIHATMRALRRALRDFAERAGLRA